MFDDFHDRENDGGGLMITAVLLALAIVAAFYLFGDQRDPASARIVHIYGPAAERTPPGLPESADVVPAPAERNRSISG